MYINRISLLLVILFGGMLLITGCFGSKKSVYLGPPPRTIPLDSVKIEINPNQFLPPADSFLIDFIVPGDSSCPVKIEFKTSQHKLKRLIADSVFSFGYHKVIWPRIDKSGDSVLTHRAYYYVITICDSSYTKSFYYRPELF